MPALIRLYITQVAIGFGISAVFVAGLLWLDVARLGHLVTHTDAGMLAVLMLWVFNGIVFAGVQFGISVMRLQDRDDRPRGGRGTREYATVPARAERRKRLL